MSGPRYAFPSLTPTYGLGSYGRVVGSTLISSPRTKIGSSGRIYAFMSNTIGKTAALQYIRDAAFGPFAIIDGRLVYN